MNLRKTALKSLAVIIAVISIPLGVWGWNKLSPQMIKAASASAGIAFGDYSLNLSSSFDLFDSLSEVEQLSISRQKAWDIDMAPQEIEVKTNNFIQPKPSKEVIDAIPYPESLNDHDGDIEEFHYGTYDGGQYINLDDGGQIRNCTNLSNDLVYNECKKDYDFEIDTESDEPQILIYHTHATESFELTERDFFLHNLNRD